MYAYISPRRLLTSRVLGLAAPFLRLAEHDHLFFGRNNAAAAFLALPSRAPNDQARVAVLRVRTPDRSWAAATRARHSHILLDARAT